MMMRAFFLARRRQRPFLTWLVMLIAVSVVSVQNVSGFLLSRRSDEGRTTVALALGVSSGQDEVDLSPRDHDTTTTTTAKKEECPFSKSFPRYRIDLTSVPKVEKSFEWPWQGSVTRNRMESQSKQRGSELRWIEGKDRVAATAILWRSASEAIKRFNKNVTLAFPDAQPRVIRQWLDLVEWMQEEDIDGLEKEVRLDCTYEYFDDSVPTITMSVRNRADAQYKAESYNQRGTAESYNHDKVTAHTKAWVKRILVEQGICPFTKSVEKSGQGSADVGVPVGQIAYHTSSASSHSVSGLCELMADTWEAIDAMLQAGAEGKNGVSSILLAAPAFDKDFNLWSGPVFCLLENGVLAASSAKEIGVVCFHPSYQTPDGTSFPGFGHMHSVPRLQQWLTEYYQIENKSQSDSQEECPFSGTDVAAGGAWQRRTPHATINVLRADQLEAAEGRRSTPKLYSENILKLLSIGSDQLQNDLERERNL